MAVRLRGKKLVIDFYCYLPDNRKVRCVESEGQDNAKNRKRVEKKWKAIQYHLNHGSFDYLEFFPHGSKYKYFIDVREEKTYSEFWEEWLNEKAIRPGTLRGYETAYTHIKPYFGEYRLSDITEHEILVFRKSLLDQGYAASTINQYILALCMPLKLATRRGLIEKHPCEEFSKLKETKPKIYPFSFDELRYWLEYLNEKDQEWHDLILFWSRTGLRPGELYALRWENIDFFNKQAFICEARKEYGGEVSGPVKTEHSEREVTLRPAVVEALKRQKTRTMMAGDWVFLNPHQKQWTAPTFRRAFKYQLKLVGLKIRPPKQMRHTFATLHIGAGESISWVSKTLGHGDVEVTLKKYNRFIPNLTRDDGSAFENVLNGNNLVTPLHKSL